MGGKDHRSFVDVSHNRCYHSVVAAHASPVAAWRWVSASSYRSLSICTRSSVIKWMGIRHQTNVRRIVAWFWSGHPGIAVTAVRKCYSLQQLEWWSPHLPASHENSLSFVHSFVHSSKATVGSTQRLDLISSWIFRYFLQTSNTKPMVFVSAGIDNSSTASGMKF